MRRIFLRDELASAAVEFALVVPVLFMLIFGIISMSAMYFSQASMHQAAERAARYWAVSDAGWSISGSCSFTAPQGVSPAPNQPVGCTPSTTDTANYSTPSDYAKRNYRGATLTGLTFTPTTGVCAGSGGTFGGPGVIVTAFGTYQFNVMFVNIPVNLSSKACYPLIQ